MEQNQYYVEQLGNTIFITKGTPKDTVRIHRTEEPMVTYICNSLYDATNIAEVLIEGQSGVIEDGVADYFIYVDHVESMYPKMSYSGGEGAQ